MIEEMARAAQSAATELGALSSGCKNDLLRAIDEGLARRADAILEANRTDLREAERSSLSAPLMKRLRFDEATLRQVRRGIRATMLLPDPVGRLLEARRLDSDLRLYRRTVPIGVIGIVFESRPDALVQISTLCLKSGNATLLKGGIEAQATNRALAQAIAEASEEAGAPPNWLQALETRSDVGEMLAQDRFVDLIVPRGSNRFVRHIMDNSSIPVMGHADGLCHLYIDQKADRDMAIRVAMDAKLQYVAVCNAIETILIHADSAGQILPSLVTALRDGGVEIRGCGRTRSLLPDVRQATEEDWHTEWLDRIVSIRIVDSLDDAVEHINRYGSHHTDAIVTDDPAAARRFMARVDAASVLHNCSTRFADGYRYGLGAEVGISTGKLHARGPVGLAGLVSSKWFLFGDGNIVADYSEGGARSFRHADLPLDEPN